MVYKLQAEIVKEPEQWKFEYDGRQERTYFGNGEVAVKIFDTECYLNISMFGSGDFKQYFSDDGYHTEIEPTSYRFKSPGFTAISFKTRLGESVWINERYYRIFRKYRLEYNGAGLVLVRKPSTLELVAVIATVKVQGNQ